ncbi:MAG TPA: hypothetical protein PKD61_25445 [Polyangiaceae bacterium]|nr:hypothetical protein [Polyangiaceae bacterium]
MFRNSATREFHPSNGVLNMGDKSPKSKQRNKNQKVAAKSQTKTDQAKRQAGFATEMADAKRKK